MQFFDVQQLGPLSPLCNKSATVAAHSLQHAMRVCLSSASCAAILWSKSDGAAHICTGSPLKQDLPADLDHGSALEVEAAQPSHGYLAVRKSARRNARETLGPEPSTGGQPCPEGQFLVGPANATACAVCNDLACRDLPEAILHPEFTRGMLTAVPGLAPPEHNLRWFNPTLIAIRGTPHIFLRGANFTLCPPGVGVHIRVNKTSPPYASQVALCEADGSTLLPLGCTAVGVAEGVMRIPPGDPPLSRDYLGIEDGRSFVWQGRMHLLGTLNFVKKGRTRNWHSPGIGLVRLSADLTQAELGSGVSCPGFPRPQKNYMPLVVEEELFVVIQTHPLIIGRIHPITWECSIQQRDEEGEGGMFLGAVLSHESFLSGGSTFIPLDAGRFLAVGHHYVHINRRVYLHHFIMLRTEPDAGGRRRFWVDWVSEAFRLPAEAGQHYGVQFSTGLMMWKGSLYISYGITDCFAALAEVPNGEAQVQRWIQQGMGTQNWRGQG